MTYYPQDVANPQDVAAEAVVEEWLKAGCRISGLHPSEEEAQPEFLEWGREKGR
ncbi:hypothetical protein [Neorhizobium galegae]|uniref:Uncharacterized protein n=1 Tax=Neorhizobium galegae bv. orientalis str. HAMBI 540 TaxID=1028800 RepID=A0A068T2A3_NEOGA|nr:hypothetical protein [Neorhizobium galegae]MCQ1854505.1 hypothetical protein [Neorhizobium galegae]CDN51620.1 Hypothetical protein RG540_PA09440 [Neorhizobium galegae bv. orientalis str. HAMBI 540]CDZ54747.1 Hypothetical protein NGAL_HAMBI2427_57910 [Neorhizobium galegae bv. orientalis]